ncbi:MAG: septum formation initiator family protein [Anaeromyxobacter sp.]
MAGKRARRWIVFLGVVATLAVASAVHPSGLSRARTLTRNVAKMQEENARLATENAELAREVRALNTDPAALERAAREELKYVRPGEKVFLVGEPREGQSP